MNNRFSLGYDELGRFMGYLWIYADTPSVELAKPEGLQLLAYEDKLDVVTDDSNTNILRQVKSPAALADIVWPLEGQTSSVPYYRIDFYRSSDVNEGTNGYYQPNAGANPYAQYYIENMSGLSNACTELRIRGGITGGITTNTYTYQTNGNESGWSLAQAGGFVYPSKLRVLNGMNELVDTETMRDSGQNVVSMIRKTHRVFAWGTSVVEKAVDPNGVNLRTTVAYYENESETGRYTRASMLVNPDGSWKKYDYDEFGRVTKEIFSWLNTDTNVSENDARVIVKDYTSVDTNYDDCSIKLLNPRTEMEKIAGVVVAKTCHVYYENEYGEIVEINEKCADSSYAYGSTNNLRETIIYYPKSSTAASSEQIKTHEYSDGKRDTFTYEYGIFVSNANPAQASFAANATGDCIRITSVHDTTNGTVTGKSTKETVVNNAFGSQLMYETYVCTSSTNYTRIGWTVTAVDNLGHPIRVDKSNGTYSEATWNCCGREWEKDENGIEYSYTYDALKRLTQKVKHGISAGQYPAQADQYTTYTYDAEGRKLTEVVSASGLSQSRTNQYDLAGRLTNSTDFAGLPTITAYSQDGLTVTETLPGGYTRITERYKDGQVKSITGTAQMPQYYACGVNEDGTKYTAVYSASNNSPVWVKTTTGLLGRTAKVEKPGYSGTEVTEYFYNSKGQLVKTTTSGKPDTLYAYDEMGNQIQSGLDINANGALDLAGLDRISESDTSYVSDQSAWWLQTVNRIYATDNSATPITNGITRQRLTGFSGNLVAETVAIDAYGNQTVSQTTVDRANQLSTQTTAVPNSSSNIVAVTVNGLMQSATTKSGNTAFYGYDALSRRTGVSDPRAGIATTHYDSHGWVDYVEDAASNRTCFTYDSATGRRISQSDPLSNTSYSSYTSHGQLEKTWGSGTYPVSYEYDAYGRMTKMNTYRGGTGWSNSTWSTSPGTADTTEWIYHEASGLLTAKKDAAGKQVSYTYATGGKLATRVWSRNSGTNSLVTTYSYSANGDLTAIDYSDSTPAVSFTYDRLGRQKTAESSVNAHAFAYNGLLLDTETIVSAAGTNIIDRSYDSLGRSTGFTLGSDYSVAYGYDSVGRFSAISSSVQSVSSVVNYSYLPNSDLISGLSSVVGPLSSASTRSYEDHRNLMMQIKNQVGSTTISQYDYVNDSGGRRTSIKYSGTAFDTGNSFNLYGYDSRNEVQTADRYWGANANDTSDPVEDQTFAYNYDNIGNRTASLRKNDEMDYTANNLNQYNQRTIPGVIDVLGSAETNTTITVNELAASRHGMYWYKGLSVTNDSASVYQEVNVVGVYSPPDTNDPEIVTSVTGHVFVAKTPELFTYDDDGNLLSDGRFAYTWDAENRLIGAETLTNLPSSVPRVKLEFIYDYMSRRVSKTVSNWNSSSNAYQVSSARSFLYDSWNLIQDRATLDATPSTNSYVWGLDLSGSLQGAGGIGGLLAVSKGTNAYVTAADGNGNISDYVDGQGTLAAHYEFDPYGNLIVATGEHADDFAFLFSSKYLDRETSLYYYGYRYYSPSLGRWFSRDPRNEVGSLGWIAKQKLLNQIKSLFPTANDKDTMNIYMFCLNNSLNRYDYLGELSCTAKYLSIAGLEAQQLSVLAAEILTQSAAAGMAVVVAADGVIYVQAGSVTLATYLALQACLFAQRTDLCKDCDVFQEAYDFAVTAEQVAKEHFERDLKILTDMYHLIADLMGQYDELQNAINDLRAQDCSLP
ncbi:MAG: hypothetical protein PHW60_15895 [Kiritimatiellae bacterium]|nr:hypothetical protein [Kiritimatiellia bacterium]